MGFWLQWSHSVFVHDVGVVHGAKQARHNTHAHTDEEESYGCRLAAGACWFRVEFSIVPSSYIDLPIGIPWNLVRTPTISTIDLAIHLEPRLFLSQCWEYWMQHPSRNRNYSSLPKKDVGFKIKIFDFSNVLFSFVREVSCQSAHMLFLSSPEWTNHPITNKHSDTDIILKIIREHFLEVLRLIHLFLTVLASGSECHGGCTIDTLHLIWSLIVMGAFLSSSQKILKNTPLLSRWYTISLARTKPNIRDWENPNKKYLFQSQRISLIVEHKSLFCTRVDPFIADYHQSFFCPI